MEVITGDTWCVRMFQDEDKASLLQLSASHYGDKEQGTEAYFDWLYSETPAGRPFVMVVEELETGDIIGFNWFVPFCVYVNGQYDTCYMGCNGLIRRDYRRKGIYNKFYDLVYKNDENRLLAYGFPKPIAGIALQKLGWTIVTDIPLLTRPLNIEKLTDKRFTKPWLRLAVNTGWKVAGNTIFRPQAVPDEFWGLEIANEDHFDESFDLFWQRIAGKYEIMIVRDCSFLNWRFKQSDFRPYTILTARDRGELVGYAVTREATLEGIKTGLLMDLLVEPGERGERAGLALAQMATNRFAAADMMMASSFLLPHTQEYELLRQTGYVAAPERFSPQTVCLIAYAFEPRTTKEYLNKTDRWFISMANHDAV